MYRGSSIELNALGESWRCRKCKKKNRLLHVWVTTGDYWSQHSAGNAKNKLLLVLGRDREFLVTIEFFLVLCNNRNNYIATWFQILNHTNCRNIDFFVVTRVVVLCRDDVATKVSLSRLRRSQREVKVAKGAWLRPRDSGCDKKL